MTKKDYVDKLFTNLDETLMEEARVRSKLRRIISELKKIKELTQ